MSFRILLADFTIMGAVFFAATNPASALATDPNAQAPTSAPVPELTVAPPTDYPDVRLFNGDASSSGQAAFNPIEPKRLVVGISSGTGCYVRRSADGGRTWGALVELPQVADAQCADEPAVAYAAGGRRLYAAYPWIIRTEYGITSGVAFSASSDHGATWSTPIDAIIGYWIDFGTGFRDARLVVAPDGRDLYVAAIFSYYRGDSLVFGSSSDEGSSWNTREESIASGYTELYGTALSGAALAAGRGGNVLVAYGWTDENVHPRNTVQVARSADHGASFLYGSADQSESLVFGDPDIKIGPFGTAHLVYAKGSNPGRAILYKYSFPPYRSWSAERVRLDDDLAPTNVSAPRLAVGACGKASVLHATWHGSPSEILYARKVAQPGYAWSEPLKVGTLKDGIREHGLAAAGPKAFSIFSGRTAPVPQDTWGIAGSRVSSGVTCP